jgi:magnesium transporter
MTDRTVKVGLGPGSLIHVGEKRTDSVSVRVMDYNGEEFSETQITDLEEIRPFIQRNSVTWIDIDGIHDSAIVEKIGELFHIHILMLEDIMNSTGRPKVEFADEYMFITLKMIEFQLPAHTIDLDQLSMIVGPNYLITFQEKSGDSFDPVRERVRTSKGMVRGKSAQYLAYLLMDVIVDNYISVSEQYSEGIEQLEASVLRRPTELTLQRILGMRKELLSFKRSIDPLKEVINSIQKEVDSGVGKYFRDLYDHIISESENLVVYREMLVNLLDLYHSSLSYRMNNVMKVLTIITTIFVPLTFIVGIYGMNFDVMPELHWQNGYYLILSLMGFIVILMLFYFRRKKWL